MRWDRFFEDLEDQLDSEWEAERAALDTEAERLRVARIPLRERLIALADGADPVQLDVAGGLGLSGTIGRVGADWCAVHDAERVWASIVPLPAVATVACGGEAVLASVRAARPGPASAQRMPLGFVVREIVRRRCAVRIHLIDGRVLAGTCDRAGADHLDLALHEPGQPRRAGSVSGFRLVPFAAVAAVALSAGDAAR